MDAADLALLAGVGFTVSLLISELSFSSSSAHNDHAKVAILTDSPISTRLATIVLRSRNRYYRKIVQLEARDDVGDGITDVYQRQLPCSKLSKLPMPEHPGVTFL